jgi:hypothetical protein
MATARTRRNRSNRPGQESTGAQRGPHPGVASAATVLVDKGCGVLVSAAVAAAVGVPRDKTGVAVGDGAIARVRVG